jgi:glycosyltransferase involved in cell wall biosynthesis
MTTKTNSSSIELSIVMPCLNEAETLAVCIRKAKTSLEQNHIAGEVLIADNGSTDGSQEVARAEGAHVVDVPRKGYGSALQGGIQAAQGRYVIMGDADDSYDFSHLMPFVEKLREGYELVMGNRFKGGIAKGAMPLLHRYLGNPVLSWLGRTFYRSKIGDFYCGLRGFSKESIGKLNIKSTEMPFALEMVVKATCFGLKITEVPTTLSPDGRKAHPPHLKTWHDGWRSLKFLLMLTPRWLFLYPGMLLLGIGLVLMAALLYEPIVVLGVGFDYNTLLYAAMSVLLGVQLLSFAVFSKAYAINNGILPDNSKLMRRLSTFSLDKGILFGLILVAAGIAATLYALWFWKQQSFGALNPAKMMRITIPAMTAFVCGVQIIFGSFYLYTFNGENK